MDGICLNCFSQRGDYEVCPYCGYVAGTLPTEGYILQPGTRLWGRYIMGTVLGTGGFGITYRAWDTRLNAQVAIKEFFPQSLVSRIPGEGKVRVFSGDKQESYSQQLGRFMDEAKNLAKFTGDAHIVSVLDYFEDNGTAYIVMEYLDGVTLKEYVTQQGGRLPVQQALAIETDLLKALSSIHSKGIIHRDISPDNIFILKDGTMKVLDFGAARFAVREDSELTQGVVVKKGYAPPEQYRTNMKQGVWTDIYAAGATLYKMVTGATPEESIERTEKDVLKRPSQTGTAVDAAVDKAVMKAMALRPELRFKSADAMLAALENRTVVDFPEEELKKRRGRNRVLIALSVVVVLALGVLVAWQASNRPASIAGGVPTLGGVEIAPDHITFALTQNNAYYNTLAELAEEFSTQYPEYQVELVPMDNDTRNALLGTDEAPTIFANTTIEGLEVADYKADLTMLVDALDLSQYWLLADYFADFDGDMVHRIPTGFTAYLGAGYPAEAEKLGITLPNAVTSFEQILALEENAEESSARVSPSVAIRLLHLYNPGATVSRRQIDTAIITEEAVAFAEAYKNDRFHYGSAFYILSSSSSTMREYFALGGATYIPVTNGSKCTGSLSPSYCVSATATENQQKVGMLFLHFLLTEYGQNRLCVQNDNTLPVNKKAYEQYRKLYPDYTFLTDSLPANLVVTTGKNQVWSGFSDDYAEWVADETLTAEDVRRKIEGYTY